MGFCSILLMKRNLSLTDIYILVKYTHQAVTPISYSELTR